MELYEIILYAVIMVCAFIMTEIYIRTKRPKLYAVLGALSGVLGLTVLSVLSGNMEINLVNSALSAILGIPGAVMVWIISAIWG